MGKKRNKLRGGNKAKVTQLRKNVEAKKARRKKILIFAVCALLAAALGAVIYFFAGQNKNEVEITDVYSYRDQTIHLYADGKFTANLAHNVRKNGTYTRQTDGGRAVVSFNVNGNIEVGRIDSSGLHLPKEWDDGHGHGSVFPRTGGSRSADNNDHDHDHGHDHDHDHDH